MKSNQFWTAVSQTLTTVTVMLIVTLVLASGAAAATTYKDLHIFNTASGGYHPLGDLIFDSAGNLYGVTADGVAFGNGVVFRLKPHPNGSWTENVLHSFTGRAQGWVPNGGLIFDAAGNLYGTTLYGGGDNDGVVFELRPNAGGSWTETVLYSFTGADGSGPNGGLIFDAAGNLYGTTKFGGAHGYGTVFELTHNPDGTWAESVLHSFTGADGANPWAGLIFDAAGNLYSTTLVGGAYGYGSVFELTHNSDGTWTKSVLHSFTERADGGLPDAGLIFDAAGNLYGTTKDGGTRGFGVVFKLTLTSTGWRETVLHTFGACATYPMGGVIMDAAGNLYGTASHGSNNGGLVFEITP